MANQHPCQKVKVQKFTPYSKFQDAQHRNFAYAVKFKKANHYSKHNSNHKNTTFESNQILTNSPKDIAFRKYFNKQTLSSLAATSYTSFWSNAKISYF